MLNDLGRAIGQLGDPAIRRVLWISLAGAAALLVALAAGVGVVFDRLTLVDWGWLDGAIDLLASLGGVVLAVLLFPAVAVAVSCLLLDQVAEAVERRHYPALGRARSAGLAVALMQGLRFFVVYLLANLFALGATLVLPGINVLVWLLVNGYLLGREYFELVAARRLDDRAMRAAFRQRWGAVLTAGMAIAVLFTIPLVNLLVPVLATAFMVHRFQRVIKSN